MQLLLLLIVTVILLLPDPNLFYHSKKSTCSAQAASLAAAVIAPSRPLHSTPLSSAAGSWKCNQGYFRTVPTTTVGGAAATCRKCTTSAAGCNLGWGLVPCTDMADTSCVPCPVLQLGKIYTQANGNCNSVGCAAGYTGAQCLPCPKGSYCIQGIQAQECGVNCTTLAMGASSPLDCIQSAGDPFAFSISYSFNALAPQLKINNNNNNINTTTTTNNNNNNNCPSLVLWASSYGVLQSCTVTLATPTQGTAVCIIAAPRCIAGEFVQWLILNKNESMDTLALIDCLQDPTLTLTSPVANIQQLPNYFSTSSGDGTYNNNNNNNNNNNASDTSIGMPKDVPSFVIETRRWGQSHGETLTTFLVAGACICGLFMGACAACTLAYTKAAKRAIAKETFEKVSEQHKSWIANKLTKTFLKKSGLQVARILSWSSPHSSAAQHGDVLSLPSSDTNPNHVIPSSPLKHDHHHSSSSSSSPSVIKLNMMTQHQHKSE